MDLIINQHPAGLNPGRISILFNFYCMKNLVILIAVCILISSSSCKRTSNWENNIENGDGLIAVFPQLQYASVNVFFADSNLLVNPNGILWLKDLLIIKDSNKELLSVYNNKNKEFMCKMITQGKGPHEFMSVNIHAYCADTLMVSSIVGERKNIYLYSYNSIKNCQAHPERIITLTYQNVADKISKCIVFHDNIISSGQFAEGVFHEFGLDGKFNRNFDTYPKINNSMEFNNYHLGHVFGYNTSFAINDSQSKFASTDRNSLTIHKYDAKKDDYVKTFFVQWHVPEVPNTSTDEKGNNVTIRSASGCIVGSGDLVSMGGLLYTPFSSSTIKNAMKSHSENIFDMLLCFNWDGNPISIIQLDKKICYNLITDVDETNLYSIQVDEKTGFKQIVQISIN